METRRMTIREAMNLFNVNTPSTVYNRANKKGWKYGPEDDGTSYIYIPEEECLKYDNKTQSDTDGPTTEELVNLVKEAFEASRASSDRLLAAKDELLYAKDRIISGKQDLIESRELEIKSLNNQLGAVHTQIAVIKTREEKVGVIGKLRKTVASML